MDFEELLKSVVGKKVSIHYVSSNQEVATLQGILKEVEKHYIRIDGYAGKSYLNRATNSIEGVTIFNEPTEEKGK